MKIGIKFSPPYSYKGGSGRTLASNLIKALYEQHSNTKLFTENNNLFSHIEGLQSYHAENPFLQKSSLKKITSWLYQQVNCENELLSKGIDILYCPYNYEALYRTHKIPQVITVHDLIPLMWQNDFKVTSTLWKYLYIPTIRNARAIITVSENTKQDILRFCNIPADRVFVVPNGFSAFTNSNDISAPYIEQPYILYVCSTHYPYKNLLKLFEAYHRISIDFLHKLVVIGKSIPRFTPEVELRISQLGLSGKVILLENLNNTEISNIYKNADLFVYPSLYEGFGIPPLEAMFHGIPVVASKSASIPEVCGEAALYIDPHSVDSLVNGMIKGLIDSELRQKLQFAGRERVKEFSWEKTANRILDICHKTIS